MGGRGLEKRTIPVSDAELRVEPDGNGGRLTGYAAVFGERSCDLGGFTEVIRRGAFRDALADSDVRALFNHEPDNLLGREGNGTLRLTTDDRGLRYSVDLDDTDLSQFVRQKVRRGDLTGSSFTFSVPENGDSYESRGGQLVRTVEEVERVGDVGPVTFPAYQGTEVSARAREEARECRVRGVDMEELEVRGRVTEMDPWELQQEKDRLHEAGRQIAAQVEECGDSPSIRQQVGRILGEIGRVNDALEYRDIAAGSSVEPSSRAGSRIADALMAIREDESQARRIAVHEAGHAVYRLAEGREIGRASIRAERRQDGSLSLSGGVCTSAKSVRDGDPAGALAGFAAEELARYSPSLTDGVFGGDLQNARQAAGGSIDERALVREAKDVLRTHWRAVEEIRDRLLELGELEGDLAGSTFEQYRGQGSPGRGSRDNLAPDMNRVIEVDTAPHRRKQKTSATTTQQGQRDGWHSRKGRRW